MKYLVVGLGNIGAEYHHSRHNIGFDVVDQWVKKMEGSFDLGRLAFNAEIKFRGKKVIVIKPTTFMNLSGKALKHWMSIEKIPMSRVLIVTDDIALPLGKIRLRAKGSAGGHNGLNDIIDQCGTPEFPRIKFGIGADFPRGRQVEFVLGKWEESELIEVESGIEKSCKMIDSFVVRGLESTMNDMN